MSTQGKKGKSRGSSWVLVVAGLVVVSVAVAAMAIPRDTEDTGDIPTFAVKQGPLTISVTEAGTIQALEQEVLKSQVEGTTTIIYLIPEGRVVEEGELLVELDASNLEDNLVEQKIRVQNAEAAFIRARENLKVVENQAKSDTSKAQLDYDFAKEDLRKYVEGEYPKSLAAAESKITLAEEELKRAKEKLKWSNTLHEEKYISQTELQADELSEKRAQLDFDLAEDELKLLIEFTHERELAQLESDIEQAKLALERAELKATADIVQADADFKAKDAELQQQKGKLAKVEQQIKNTKIYAPRAGLVVYATSAKSSWRGNDEPLDEGSSVREREELIYLPTAEQMMAQVQIHESNLEKIRLGLPARITIDALQGSSYIGHVTKIAPMPNAHAMRLNPGVKKYLTEITLEGRNPELRTGMSCEAEIIVDQLDDALYIPVQAVLRGGSEHIVEVMNNGVSEQRKVKVGLDNNRMVHIKYGLAMGDVVSLAPELKSGALVLNSDDPEEQAEKAQFQAAIERAKQSPPAGRGNRGPAAQGDQKESPAGGDRPQMTAKQREEMRKRLENMTPEQRRQLRERMQRGGGGDRSGA